MTKEEIKWTESDDYNTVSATIRGYKIEIRRDEGYASPNDWDNEDAFLIGFSQSHLWVVRDGLKCQEDLENWKDTHHIYLVEAYIHSGIRLALADSLEAQRFPDRRWDVSSIGVVLVTKGDSGLKSETIAQGIVELWNQYLSGDVWGYNILNKRGDCVDSCWGFYGLEDAQGEALSMVPEEGDTTEPVEESHRKMVEAIKRCFDRIPKDLIEELKAPLANIEGSTGLKGL